jgi:hypothetical protein
MRITRAQFAKGAAIVCGLAAFTVSFFAGAGLDPERIHPIITVAASLAAGGISYLATRYFLRGSSNRGPS